ncbi:DUF6286 domain-containing Asp23/Gls24 family envelope stress response protein [Actinomadura flavalba]|uniref:DUF6286 domain-containing Asp23/Gls24 family envelope stress response protein n=1 Tax=Actinomadura flavalba TaxID=1120938 RepID=UPI00039C3986|nr:DUF6286 domain-containing protein [Actinomadura flavalba]
MTAPAERGATEIAPRAVRRIAEGAASEAGVRATGAHAEVTGRRARVEVRVGLPYPARLGPEAGRVRDHVRERTGRLTGLDVRAAKVTVDRLDLREGNVRRTRPSAAPGVARRRWWSARPSARVVPVPAGVAVALLAVEVLVARLPGHRPWRGRAAAVDLLYRYGPGDAAVTVAAVVMVAVGCWLVALAVTPGRGRLAAGPDAVRADVGRRTVAALVGDEVRQVPGVNAANVRVRRKKVRVRASLTFGDRDAARERVRGAAREALTECRLGAEPRLRVSVRPAPSWQPTRSTEDEDT